MSNELRAKLIEMVVMEGIKPKKSAAILGIEYQNAKALLKVYRREGRVINNKIKTWSNSS